jgi:hypothetical protein
MMLRPAAYLDDDARKKLSGKAQNWGYTLTGRGVDDLRIFARCAGFRDKWELIRRHAGVVTQMIPAMTPESANKAMFDAADLRDGLAHGHAVLPINSFAQQYEPIPAERFRKQAEDLVGLITVMRHVIDSIRRYVRARKSHHLGGDFRLQGSS